MYLECDKVRYTIIITSELVVRHRINSKPIIRHVKNSKRLFYFFKFQRGILIPIFITIFKTKLYSHFFIILLLV